MDSKRNSASNNHLARDQEAPSLSTAPENNQDAAGRLSAGEPDATPDATSTLYNEPQQQDSLLAEETSMYPSLGDVISDAPPVPAGYIAAIVMDEEDDLQREISVAPNRINHFSNDQGYVEAPTVEDDVEIFPGDEAPMPPQNLSEEVVDSDPIIEKKKPASVDVGRLPTSESPRINSSPAIENTEMHEDGNVQPLIPPEPNIAETSEILVGANSEMHVWRNAPIPAEQVPERQDTPPLVVPNTAPLNPPPVPFYEVEARLVNDSERDDSDSERDEQPRQSVYNAILVQDPSLQPGLPVSRWQTHQRAIFISIGTIIILIVGSLVAIGLIVLRRSSPEPSVTVPISPIPTSPPTLPLPPASPDLSPKPTPSPIPTLPPTLPPPPPIDGISNVTPLGNFSALANFAEADCGDSCAPFVVAIDGGTAVVAPLLVKPSSGRPLDAPVWKQRIHILNKTMNGGFGIVQQIDVDFQPGSIAIFGDVMVVGSNWETLETGAAYIYERNSLGLWDQMQRIVPADSRQDAEFGFHVDIYKDIVVIGAYQDREGKIGSVYIYRQKDSHWALERKLTPPDDGKITNFGIAIAIRGNRIAVGDYSYNEPKKGAVWVYEYDSSSKNWTELSDVMTNADCDNWFGASLAFTYDYGLLIGCPREDKNVGAVYYYEPSDTGYVFRQKMVASDGDGGRGDKTGYMNQLSVYNNVMVVGIYIFLRINDVWVETKKIVSPEESQKFVNKLAMSGNHILVSSRHNAYFYELVKGPPTTSCISSKADGAAIFNSDCKRCNPFVAIDGDYAVISKNEESLQIISGADVDVSRGNMALFGVGHDFGGVAISGNVVVTGAPSVNDKNGYVSVFTKISGIWFESAQLSPDIIGHRENFGGAVDIDADVIIVGAYDYIDNRGSAYIFRNDESSPWSGWAQEAKLLPDDPNLQGFGRAVSVINNTVAIGDRTYKDSSGAVFVYVYEPSSRSWTQLNEAITNNDCGGMFGSSLALTRDNGLLIGCPGEQGGTGAVYYYTQAATDDQYFPQQKIQSLDGVFNDDFGASDRLAVDGDIMVVGTDKETNGTVHVFAKMKNAWIEVDTIDSPPQSRGFGYKVALSGRKVLVSSIYNVYSYTLGEC
mmetsp:Transcript_18558/g.32645  ORF Transcript_18558/g.32645 Transcript_18558/m.32645 type:complete len:1114 (+) Transcript_18558:41-3382(+)